MPGQIPVRNTFAHNTAPDHRAICPFHDGAATLDMLLAELAPEETRLFDAALDLRTLWLARSDAGACVAQLFRVRSLLQGRHHLAFYRVRCCARRLFRVEARSHRGTSWVRHDLPIGAGRLDEVFNTVLAAVAVDGEIPPTAHVRFAFA